MLSDDPAFLQLGNPRFRSSALARMALDDGPESAWRHALAQAPIAEVAREVDGPFAVAVREGNGTVHMAVDRFAIHTLCYRTSGGRLSFSPSADRLGSSELDEQALLDYLYFHVIPSPRTVFAGVSRLPPAHCATFKAGQLHIESYWVPVFRPDPRPSLETLREEFQSLLEASVRTALGTGKPACFLSGGTDSSTVAGMIGRACDTPAATYSIGFDAQGYDEMSFARIAAKHFGTEHHEHYVTPDQLVEAIPKVASHFDQPFGNSSALPSFICSRVAREDGVTRLLAGDGGDELFGGNSRYAAQRVFDWYATIPAVVRSRLIEPVLSLKGSSRLPLLRRAASYVEQAKMPLVDRMQRYNLLLRLGFAEVLEPAFANRVDLQDPQRQQREVWHSAAAPTDELNTTLAYDWRYTLAEADLPKVRNAASLASVDVAFPMLDSALVDFSLRLPVSYKVRGLTLRWFFKEALRDFLPPEIITKKKQGFGLPFGVWCLQHPGLLALATESLRSLSARGIVSGRSIEQLLTQQLQQHPGYFGEMVWILMMLEQWMRSHSPNYRSQC